MIAAARLFFAVLGAAVFLWVGLVARGVGARSLFFVAPLVLATSGLIQQYGAIQKVPGPYRRDAEMSNAYEKASKALAKAANENVKNFEQELKLDCSVNWPGRQASLTTVVEPKRSPAIRGCVF